MIQLERAVQDFKTHYEKQNQMTKQSLPKQDFLALLFYLKPLCEGEFLSKKAKSLILLLQQLDIKTVLKFVAKEFHYLNAKEILKPDDTQSEKDKLSVAQKAFQKKNDL